MVPIHTKCRKISTKMFIFTACIYTCPSVWGHNAYSRAFYARHCVLCTCWNVYIYPAKVNYLLNRPISISHSLSSAWAFLHFFFCCCSNRISLIKCRQIQFTMAADFTSTRDERIRYTFDSMGRKMKKDKKSAVTKSRRHHPQPVLILSVFSFIFVSYRHSSPN